MQKILAPLISTLALVGVLISSYFLYSLNQKVEGLKPQETLKEELNEIPESEAVDECGDACVSHIERVVAEAVATISASPKTTTQIVSPSTSNQTGYIPLDGPVSTTSTSWINVPGVEVSIDLANDYSSAARVSWEGSLKVDYGNGQAFARLFDVTHGIAVDASEISTTANSTFVTISSGYMNFWSGRNLYRLQLKSLTGYEATFSSGRIKVTY